MKTNLNILKNLQKNINYFECFENAKFSEINVSHAYSLVISKDPEAIELKEHLEQSVR